MKPVCNSLPWIICILILASFNPPTKEIPVNFNLEKYERMALQSDKAGTEYIIDLTGIKGCNKTRVKYLGLVNTTKGKQYKVLTSFYVFGTSCRGTSNIKIYDVANKFLGHYDVGMPHDLPDTLIGNKLVYTTMQKECPSRKRVSINLSNGLPKRFFLPCSPTGGNEYVFSN